MKLNLAAATISQIPNLRLERLKAEYMKVYLCWWREAGPWAFRSTISGVSVKSVLANIREVEIGRGDDRDSWHA
jgi:hypothetical protein